MANNTNGNGENRQASDAERQDFRDSLLRAYRISRNMSFQQISEDINLIEQHFSREFPDGVLPLVQPVEPGTSGRQGTCIWSSGRNFINRDQTFTKNALHPMLFEETQNKLRMEMEMAAAKESGSNSVPPVNTNGTETIGEIQNTDEVAPVINGVNAQTDELALAGLDGSDLDFTVVMEMAAAKESGSNSVPPVNTNGTETIGEIQNTDEVAPVINGVNAQTDELALAGLDGSDLDFTVVMEMAAAKESGSNSVPPVNTNGTETFGEIQNTDEVAPVINGVNAQTDELALAGLDGSDLDFTVVITNELGQKPNEAGPDSDKVEPDANKAASDNDGSAVVDTNEQGQKPDEAAPDSDKVESDANKVASDNDGAAVVDANEQGQKPDEVATDSEQVESDAYEVDSTVHGVDIEEVQTFV